MRSRLAHAAADALDLALCAAFVAVGELCLLGMRASRRARGIQ